MIKGEIDRRTLEASLRKYAKKYGESTAQAVVRWGIQVARDLAFDTQVYGTRQTRQIQENAIFKDALNVFLVVDGITKITMRRRTTTSGKTVFSSNNRSKSVMITNGGKKFFVKEDKICTSESQFNFWIEMHRTRRAGSRTLKLDKFERLIVDRGNFAQWLKPRLAKAGMAKGGWIGAGRDLMRVQNGPDKANIGKNFLNYAQKHAYMGMATKPKPIGSPYTQMTNRVNHVGSDHVLNKGRIPKAQKFALRKTVKFYSKALKALDKKR